MTSNSLYYGDNLDILRRYVEDESADLIYLDPPFNSKQTYNILFQEKDGTQSASQIKAFGDTWHWDETASRSYEETVEVGGQVSEGMQAFRKLLGTNDMLAYMSMIAPRLVELRRVLKPTGSLYLHCDPTASHYLKLLLDAVFGPKQFRSEIIWRRTGSHGKIQRYAPIHDTLFFYSKSATYTWNQPKKPYMQGHIDEFFVRDSKGYKTNYFGNVLTGSGKRGGESGKPWKGVNPTAKNRHWAIPGSLLNAIDEDLSGLSQHQKLDRLYDLGLIKIIPGQAWPIYEHYLTPKSGQPAPDIWAFQRYTDNTVSRIEKGVHEDVRWLSTKPRNALVIPLRNQ